MISTDSPATVEMDEIQFERELVTTSDAAIRLARSLGRSPEDAADVVQDAAAQAWRYRSTLRGEWKPWFLSIVYRQAKRRTPEWLPLPASWDKPSHDWPGSAPGDDILKAAIGDLPSRQRAALVLYYAEDMKIEAVAHVLGVSEAATKQLLSRARTSLKERYSALSERVS